MFYQRYSELCEEKGVSLKEVQRELGLCRTIDIGWKKRGTVPAYAILKKLAQYFGVSVDYLVGDSDTK